MKWNVEIDRRIIDKVKKMPVKIRDKLNALVSEIRIAGPVRGNWDNYGKLSGNRHHCHLKKGKPCYVAVWEVSTNEIRLVEVKYVGTHEKAPY